MRGGGAAPKTQRNRGTERRMGEAVLARKVRASGGEWDKGAKVWRVKYQAVVELGLKDRILPGI